MLLAIYVDLILRKHMLNQIWCDAYVCVCACRRWMVTVTLLSSRCSGWKSCVFMYDPVGIRVWCAGLWLRMRQGCSGREIRSPHPVLVVCWSQELRQFPGKAPVSDTSVTWYSLRRPPARTLVPKVCEPCRSVYGQIHYLFATRLRTCLRPHGNTFWQSR